MTISSPTHHLSSPRYAPSIIALHWLTVILIVLAYGAMEFREIFEKGTPGRDLMKATHFSLGLTILGLTLWRIAARVMTGPVPEIDPPLQPWMALAAKAGHLALYVFLIAMPILGWMILSGEGKAIPFWGLEMPALIGQNKETAESVEEIHKWIGTFGYLLIGGHAAIAILHHHVMKDTTLVRMMPKKKAHSA